MSQFKCNSNLQAKIRNRLQTIKDLENPFDKEISSPANCNDQFQTIKAKSPFVMPYQTHTAHTSNSEFLGRKNKARVKFEVNARISFKRSFEESKSPQCHKNLMEPKEKQSATENQNKQQRPSFGGGSSPQGSSVSSSKGCASFSNRSSNVSTINKQTIPESNNHKTLNLHQQAKHAHITKIEQIKQTKDKGKESTQLQQQAGPNKNGGASRQLLQSKISPLRKISVKVVSNNTIADEKPINQSKQAIETPKFNDYYSLLGKNASQNQIGSVARSKSLVKNNLIRSQIHMNKHQIPQSSLTNDNIIMKLPNSRVFMQSSCSNQLDDNSSSDPSFKNANKKVIRLKKSDIKFQMIEQEQKKLQNLDEFIREELKYSEQRIKQQQTLLNKSKHLQLDLIGNISKHDHSSFMLASSPKIYQNQQQAKETTDTPLSQSTISEREERYSNRKANIQKRTINFAMTNETMNYKEYLNDIDYNMDTSCQEELRDLMLSDEKPEGTIQNYYESPVHKKLFQKVKEVSSTLTTYREDSSAQPTFKSFNPNNILGQYCSNSNNNDDGIGSISAIQSIFEENDNHGNQMIALPSEHPKPIQKKQSRYFESNSNSSPTRKDESDFTQMSVIQESFERSGSKLQAKIMNHNAKPSVVTIKGSFLSNSSNVASEGRQIRIQEQMMIIMNGDNYSNKRQSKMELISSSDIINMWREKYSFRDQKLSTYYELISKQKCSYEFEIEKDIERTFHNDALFHKGARNYKRMQRVLRAVANHSPSVGYVQGFNFIVGYLIKSFSEEQLVFWIFINILESYDIYQMYTDGMPKLKLLQFQLNCFVQNLMPELELHLSKKCIMIEFFTSQWFLTLFSFEFTQDFFLQFLCQLFNIGPLLLIQLPLALIEYIQDDLINLEMEDAMIFLKEFIRDLDLPLELIFKKAASYTQVTEQRMNELEKIWRTSKNKKRVLFVKDHDKDVTYLKTLPNLPDDEQLTECNVEDEIIQSDEDEREFSPSVNENKRQQINNSLLLNNAAMDRPQSSQQVQQKSMKYVPYEDSNELEIQLILDEEIEEENQVEENHSFSQIYLDEKYASAQEQRESQREVAIKHILEYQAQGFDNDEICPTQKISYQVLNDDKMIPSLKSGATHRYKVEDEQFDKLEDIFEDDHSHQIINSKNQFDNQKSIKNLFNQLQIKKFVHSPSLDNLRSSIKLNQKSSQLFQITTPGSEDINDSGNKKANNVVNFGGNLKNKIGNITKGLSKILQYESREEETSQNISNIEEFINELEFEYNQEKFQNTQRLTTRRDFREDLTERETLKLSWTKSRPFHHKDLQLQFDLNKMGSHLNTPHFQNTNRSTTILQEKRINHPINSFDCKKSALLHKNLNTNKIQENYDPNINSQMSTIAVKPDDFIGQRALEQFRLLHSSDEQPLTSAHLKKSNRHQKAINNFQRFSVTQKNPLNAIQQKKKSDKQVIKTIHNLSANTHKPSDSAAAVSNGGLLHSSRNNLDDVVNSMKSPKQKIKRSTYMFGSGIMGNYNYQGPLSDRGSSDYLTQRSGGINHTHNHLAVNIGGYGGSGGGQNLLSPRTLANNKQSQKLCVHKGDNFQDENEMTTIVTPKESFYMNSRPSKINSNKMMMQYS